MVHHAAPAPADRETIRNKRLHPAPAGPGSRHRPARLGLLKREVDGNAGESVGDTHLETRF